jgi:hypothetical protein
MPTQIARPDSVWGAPGAARRTVLLTGASGVVGRALLQRLRDFDVVPGASVAGLRAERDHNCTPLPPRLGRTWPATAPTCGLIG